MTPLSDTKTEKVAELILLLHPGSIRRMLVVGCGSGLEAAILADRLGANVTGIDIEEAFEPECTKRCILQQGDAMDLEFPNGAFDFVYSFHALEHIEDPVKALHEIARVLTDGGGFWIGTPNRNRMVGYLGGKGASFREKLRWNILDWRMRLAGRFENRFGAHAGFSRGELQEMLDGVFRKVDDRTFEYFRTVYPGKLGFLRTLERTGASRWAYPSIYFSGRK